MAEVSKPIKKFMAHGVSLAVFENKGTTKDGRKYSFNSISVQRCYKDEKGEWQNTETFREKDLLTLSMLSHECAVALSLNKAQPEED